MPIRLKRHYKSFDGTQVTEVAKIIVKLSGGPTASYMDRNTDFRVLCGSI
jgi:hypothetical protein